MKRNNNNNRSKTIIIAVRSDDDGIEFERAVDINLTTAAAAAATGDFSRSRRKITRKPRSDGG